MNHINHIPHIHNILTLTTMSLEESFHQAVAGSKQLTTRPDNATLLRLYSLYKQAMDGDAPITSDGGTFDFVAKAKHNAWDGLRGKTKEAAMEEYIQLAASLKD